MGTILRLRLAAVPESLPKARHAALDALDQATVSGAIDRSSIALALSEAVANAVRHAYTDPASGDVEVTIVTDQRDITITVVDHGMGLEQAQDGSDQGPGLGLKLIDQLATTATIHSSAEGTTVTLRFALPDRLP